MRQYAEYSKTKADWLPDVPAHWSEQRIKTLFSLHDERNYLPLSEVNLISLYAKMGVIQHSDIEHTTGNRASNADGYKIVNKDDIIVNILLCWMGAIGRSDYNGVTSPAYDVYSPKEGVNSRYYHYLFRLPSFSQQCYRVGKGIMAMRWRTYSPQFCNIVVPVPPCSEQDQIVRFLDWKVSMINRLINTKRKEIKAVDAMKRSMVSSAVTRGLNPDASMKYSGVKWLGDIPAHWGTIKLRQLLHPVSIKNHPELPLLSVVREQGVIVRDIDDRKANHNYIPDDLSGYKMVKKGQFAMNKMKAWQGSYGISDYTGIVSPAYFIFNVAFDNLEYFHYAIRSKVYVNFFAQASDGIRVGQWDLQMDKMKEIPFIVPPADEQIAIVEYIKKTHPKYDEAIEKLTAEASALEEYKAKLIADVVTGKVDVRYEKIPNYEFVDEEADSEAEGENDDSEEQED
ncbi:MAG: restriction endonuclease subunit S [Ruminococcus sp.]|nr:restriction endonuclease subunit S [Ruminococcus sp.]